MRAEIYKREDGLWDWRVVARNGEIIATSGGQGFTERGDAKESILRLDTAVFEEGFTFVDADEDVEDRAVEGDTGDET